MSKPIKDEVCHFCEEPIRDPHMRFYHWLDNQKETTVAYHPWCAADRARRLEAAVSKV